MILTKKFTVVLTYNLFIILLSLIGTGALVESCGTLTGLNENMILL